MFRKRILRKGCWDECVSSQEEYLEEGLRRHYPKKSIFLVNIKWFLYFSKQKKSFYYILGLILTICDGYERSLAFLQTGQTADIFLGLEKHFSFRQWLNNLAKIQDNSELRFLRINTGMLFRPLSS